MLLRTSTLVVVLFLFLSAENGYEVGIMQGTWKRVNDAYAGMVLIVHCQDLFCTGILTEVPETPLLQGYRRGQMKWKNIHVENGEFVLEDFAVRENKYIPVRVQLISKDEVRLWNETFTGFCIGEEQIWERVLEL